MSDVSQARERAIINLLRSRLVSDIRFRGADDDAAVLACDGNRDLVITVDAQTEGKDFQLHDDPFYIGRYALAASASDLGAMGASPAYYLVDVMLPYRCGDEFFLRLADGMQAFASSCGGSIVGGDTENAQTISRISVTSVGFCESGQELMRTGAVAGDLACLVGVAGRPIAECVLRNFRDSTRPFLEDMGLVQVGATIGASRLAKAAIDTSDGIYAALSSLCVASGVGCILECSEVPLHVRAQECVGRTLVTREQFVLSELSDHLLIVVVQPSALALLKGLVSEFGLTCTSIGRFTEDLSIVVLNDDRILDINGVSRIELLEE